MTVLGLLSRQRVVVDAQSIMKNLDDERRENTLAILER
jgi:hypothetical protein